MNRSERMDALADTLYSQIRRDTYDEAVNAGQRHIAAAADGDVDDDDCNTLTCVLSDMSLCDAAVSCCFCPLDFNRIAFMQVHGLRTTQRYVLVLSLSSFS